MEKFDGTRVYWDGKNLLSQDKAISIPIPKELAPFPSVPFEGELWFV
jgi:hypothetical protein